MNRLLSLFPAALVALVFGFIGAWGYSLTPLQGSATRAWLMDHPDVLRDMAQRLQDQENAKRLAGIRADLTSPFPGAVLGNPQGTVTLVEFSDYGCTFCRHSVPDVQRLIAANPDLRVVVREWPIFEGSEAAARMALAAARQGKYAAFHDAMYAGGPPSKVTILAAARKAGVDLERAEGDGGSPQATLELQKNYALARQMGFEGTPAWIAGDRVFTGAVGEAQLADAIAAARKLNGVGGAPSAGTASSQ